MTRELRLLLACARTVTITGGEAEIREMLDRGIDWPIFVRQAIGHGLAGLAAHSFASVAPDRVPDDILAALRAIIDQSQRENRALLGEFAAVSEALADNGIAAITFKGPVFAIQAYGDFGLTIAQNLQFLLRDSDLASTIAALCNLGYERNGRLTGAQLDLNQGLFTAVSATIIESLLRYSTFR
jgi:hypothetical protein